MKIKKKKIIQTYLNNNNKTLFIMNNQFIPQEDYYFYQLLQNPIENEQEIVNILSQRFEQLQTKQNITYTLVIGSPGSTSQIEISDTDPVLIQIPILFNQSQ